MSQLFILTQTNNGIAVQDNAKDVAIVQGNRSTIQDGSVSPSPDGETREFVLGNDFVLSLKELKFDGNKVRPSNINFDPSKFNLLEGRFAFSEVPDVNTIEVTYDYVNIDQVNDTISLDSNISFTNQTNQSNPTQLNLVNGEKILSISFDETDNNAILSADNVTDSSVTSGSTTFIVLNRFFDLKSVDNSIETTFLRSGINLSVRKIDNFPTARAKKEDKLTNSGNTNIDSLLVGYNKTTQRALDNATDPSDSNPFVTATAVIDVLEALGNAVDTKEDLRDVDINNVQDKEMRLVKNLGSIFFYDADSSKGDDNKTVLKPNDLSSNQNGRWELANKRSNSHSNLNDLNSDDHNQYLNSTRHSNEDHRGLQGVIFSGPKNSRPNSQKEDIYYYATDDETLDRDTGSGWETLIDFNNTPTSNEKDALSGSSGSPSSTNPYLTEDEKGNANGVAELDSDSEVSMSQLKGGENDGVATLDGSGNVESSQLSDTQKKHFVEDPTYTQISSGFSSTSYSTVDVTSETSSSATSIKIQVINKGGSATQFNFRKSGTSIDGPNRVNLASNGSVGDSQMVNAPLNGSGEAEFKVDGNSVDVYIVGYHTS